MSNISQIIEERPASIGNFMVGRLLPFRSKRMVGPFAFIDHMGPAELNENDKFDVPPHPHIGLSTLTYLFEGSIMHRDSLGSEIEINPGAVNWMTAGKGIVHSERTPERLKGTKRKIHGLQIWVALPQNLEQMEPSFTHISKEELPSWEEKGVSFKLIAGTAFGRTSPVPVYSPMYFVEIKSSQAQTLNIGSEIFGEVGLYILNGSIKNDGNTYESNRILVAKESSLCAFEIAENSTIYLFGGDAFPEERIINWNFVSSDRKLIQKAIEDWKNQTFPKIPGETDFVPMPER
jgi:redox-sensitive bicupin YhaK (pirin superfamily)